MLKIKLKIKGEILETEFDFDKHVITWVKNVLKCLEGKKIAVPDPKRKLILPLGSILYNGIDNYDDTKYFEIYNRFKHWLIPIKYYRKLKTTENLGLTHISILKWLPLVCKRVYFENKSNIKKYIGKIVYGYYDRFNELPTPINKAFDEEFLNSKIPDNHIFSFPISEIVILDKLKKSENAFCFVLAHELYHAIDWLEVIYPANADWEGFKHNVLEINQFNKNDLRDIYFNKWCKKVILDQLVENQDYSEIGLIEGIFGFIAHDWYDGFIEFIEKNSLVRYRLE